MSKAQFFSITQFFQLLLTGILAWTSVAMLTGGYTNIEKITQENYAERNAISLINALIAHPSLSYYDGETFSRGILDKDKLDTMMIKKSDFESNWQEKLQPNEELSSQISFPNFYALITVLDSDSDDAWIVSIAQRNDEINNFIDCLKNNKKDDVSKLFELDSFPWKVFDIDNCNLPLSSTIASFHGYPVAIRYPDYSVTHTGLIRVWVVEK